MESCEFVNFSCFFRHFPFVGFPVILYSIAVMSMISITRANRMQTLENPWNYAVFSTVLNKNHPIDLHTNDAELAYGLK